MPRNRLIILFLFLLIIPVCVHAELSVSIGKDPVEIGEFVHIAVEKPEDAVSITYSMTQNGKSYFETKDARFFEGEFCPRREGQYVLKVKVRKSDRTTDTGVLSFTVVSPDSTPLHAETTVSPTLRFDQKDGWWKGFSYGSGTLNKSGCAIFTLSHVLARLGFTGEDILPSALAETYKKCHVKGGTSNSMLIGLAAKRYGFLTADDVIESPGQIQSLLKDGCFFSFSIVIGHIALIDGISEDGLYVHIVDSAPEATLSRIKKGALYLKDETDTYRQISDLSEVPGLVWYPETGSWSSLEYWMDLDYVAKRGVRLIQPYWLYTKDPETGSDSPVEELVSVGQEESVIRVGDRKTTVKTASLDWSHDESGKYLAKVVTGKSFIRLNDAEGQPAFKVKPGDLLPVIAVEKKTVEVRFKNLHYYLPRSSVELISID